MLYIVIPRKLKPRLLYQVQAHSVQTCCTCISNLQLDVTIVTMVYMVQDKKLAAWGLEKAVKMPVWETGLYSHAHEHVQHCDVIMS